MSSLKTYVPISVALKLEGTSECPGGLVKALTARPTPLNIWFSRSTEGLEICISNQFPGGGTAASPGTTLWRQLPYLHWQCHHPPLVQICLIFLSLCTCNQEDPSFGFLLCGDFSTQLFLIPLTTLALLISFLQDCFPSLYSDQKWSTLHIRARFICLGHSSSQATSCS